MPSKILYYLVVNPVSHLPLRVMYIFTDFIYLLLITIVPYRRKVVRKNLINSFPNKSKKELRKIERRFYRHLTNLLAEGIKNLNISEKALKKRFSVVNSEVLEELYNQNKSVLLVSGHYNNWEWLITAQNLIFSHQAVGIGMPLSNSFWDKKINEKRARFGMKIIHSKIVNSFFNNNKECIATLILADQSPGETNKCYWTEFLNQQTGVVYGPELLAHKYNHAVVFFHIKKIKRGKYSMELELITDAPRTTKWGEITTAHVRLLEEIIVERPENWLWSHKRWKREVPDNLEELKKVQYEKFLLLRSEIN